MGIRRIIAYTALALAPLLAGYSGVALSQNVSIPSNTRTVAAPQFQYSPPYKELAIPQFPFNESDIQDAFLSHITYMTYSVG